MNLVDRTLIAALVIGAAGNAFAATSLSWDTDYGSRYNVDVATGPSAPDKGYAG